MAIRYHTQAEHDQVIMASALTYEHLKGNGYMVSVNPDGHQNHDVGAGNFPDLVIWKTGGEVGYSLIIEEVETAESVTDHESLEWERYARFGARFFLIVPKEWVDTAKEIIKRRGISVDQVEAYWFEGGQVKFATRV